MGTPRPWNTMEGEGSRLKAKTRATPKGLFPPSSFVAQKGSRRTRRRRGSEGENGLKRSQCGGLLTRTIQGESKREGLLTQTTTKDTVQHSGHRSSRLSPSGELVCELSTRLRLKDWIGGWKKSLADPTKNFLFVLATLAGGHLTTSSEWLWYKEDRRLSSIPRPPGRVSVHPYIHTYVHIQ